ncbi:hypothetical protein ACHAXS_008199 [Conticribra weissflogii]
MRLPPSSQSPKSTYTIVSATITADERNLNLDRQKQKQQSQKQQHPLQEQMQRSRNLPSMIMNACSDNRSRSRDQMFCSPPTVPYLSPSEKNSTQSSSNAYVNYDCEHSIVNAKCSGQGNNQDLSKTQQLRQEVNSVPVEDVIRWKEFRRKQKSLQHSATNETAARKNEEVDRLYESRAGTENGEDIPQLGSLSLSLSLSSSTSMSDLSKKCNAGTAEVVNQGSEKLSHSVKNGNMPQGAIEIDDAGFPVTPVSSSSSVPGSSSESFFTASDVAGGRASYRLQGGVNNVNMQGEIVISDTALSCRNGEGGCEFEEHASSSEVPTEVMSNTMTSRLLESSITSHPKNKLGVVQENFSSEVPAEVISNTTEFVAPRFHQMASKKMPVEVIGEPVTVDSQSAEHGQHTIKVHQKPDNNTQPSTSKPDATSDVPNFSPYSPDVSGKSVAATPSSAPLASSPTESMPLTPLENGASQASVASSPFNDESPISCSREVPKNNGTLLNSLGENTERYGRKNRIEKQYEQVWDDSRTTLDVDQLERVLSSDDEDWHVRRSKCSTMQEHDSVQSEILSTEKACSDNIKDLSIVAFDWDPLQVSTIDECKEEDEKSGDTKESSDSNDNGDRGIGGDCDGGVEHDSSNGHNEKIDVLVNSFGEKHGDNENSLSAPFTEISTCQYSSPTEEGLNTSPSKSSPANSSEVKTSPREDAPTLSEVKKFMARLEELREERMDAMKSRSAMKPQSKSSCLPPVSIQNSIDIVCSESGDVVVKQENLEFMRSLLEKKDKLRQHKLDAERKKKELDARLKSMRSKVYEQSKIEKVVIMFENNDRNELTMMGQSSTTGPKESPRKQSSLVMPGARWSGGLARWSPANLSASSPTIHTSVTTPCRQFKQIDPSTLNTTNVVDDFSFKPTPVAGANHFSFSPISTSANSNLKFVFSASPKTAESSMKNELSSGNKQQSSPQVESIEPPSSPSTFRRNYMSSNKKDPSVGRDLLTPNQRNSSTPKDPSPLGNHPTPGNGDAIEIGKKSIIATSSPDLSEGDKGGGGFGPGDVTGLGDKSVVSKSSSKFVELGGTESCTVVGKNEAQNLLGVTVLGSKEKKKAKKTKPTLMCETVDEQSKDGSCESLQEIPTRVAAPDPPGENANNIDWKKSNSVDIGGALTFDELDITDTPGFESVMKRVGNFDLTPRSKVVSLTPRSSVSILNATTPRVSHQSNSVKKIGRGPRDVDMNAKCDNAEIVSTMAPHNSLINELRLKFESKPESDKVSVDEELDREKTLDQFKIGVNTSGSSEDSISIKELRKRFEPKEGATRLGCGAPLRGMQVSPSQPTLNFTGNQGQNSLESKTHDTNESSMNKSSMDDDDGENSLDTKRVLSYARILEKRGMQKDILEQQSKISDEGDSFRSFDNTIDKSLSSKENAVEESAAGNPKNTHISPVKLRKMVFERNKPEKIVSVHKPTSATEGKINSETDAPPDKNNSKPIGRNQPTRTADSIKDRIASFANAVSGKGAIQPTAMTTSNYSAKQRDLSDSSRTNNAPDASSHLWPARREMPFPQVENFKRNVMPGNSDRRTQVQSFGYPVLTPIHATSQLAKPVAGQFVPAVPAWASGRRVSTQHMYPNQYTHIQSQPRYESPKAHHFDDDDEDGITLSPTCSEVSGLTTPTCLISVPDDGNDAKSKMSNKSHFSKQSDVFDNITLSSMPPSSPYQEAMSPIARHRQQQSTFSSRNKLSKHPYVQRVNSEEKNSKRTDSNLAMSRSKSNPQGKIEIFSKQNNVSQTSGAQGNISRRDQIVSKIKGKKSAILVNPINNNKQQPNFFNMQSAKQQSAHGVNAPKHVGDQQVKNDIKGVPRPSTKHHQSHSSNQSGEGRVAERIAAVNRRYSSEKLHRNAVDKSFKKSDRYLCSRESRKHCNGSWMGRTRENENESSLATRDCLRVD